MVDLFHNPPGKSRLCYRYFVEFLVACTIFVVAAAASGAESSAPADAYLYPPIVNWGVLNTLNGVNIDDARVAIEMNLNRQAVSIRQGTKPKLDIIPDLATAAERIRQKKLHGLAISGIDFILLRELVPTKPLYVASALPDSPVEYYFIVTQKAVGLDQLAARGQRRLMVESQSQWDIGRIWLETVLHQKKLPKSNVFFTAIKPADKPARLVLPVFFNQAEACLVLQSAYNTMVELNPQIGKRLHVIFRSPGFVQSLVSIVDYLHPDFVAQVEKSLQNMHNTDDGRQLMMIFRHRRYFPFKSEYLIETERVLRRYQDITPEFAKHYPKSHQADVE